jgi:hypothetical protein
MLSGEYSIRQKEHRKMSTATATDQVQTLARVFRYFKEERHAEALMQGDVWLSTLNQCREYETVGQGDPEEATEFYRLRYAFQGTTEDPDFARMAKRAGVEFGASQNVEIVMSESTKRISDAFVLCTTEKQAAATSAVFGLYCVEINQPAKFGELVHRRLLQKHPAIRGMLNRVNYAPLEYRDLEEPPGSLGFVKRPDAFADQCEVRFLWIPVQQTNLKPFGITVPGVARLCRRVK